MLEVEKIFSNHMILQREKPICVWGKYGNAKREIQVQLLYEDDTILAQETAYSKEDGSWQVVLPPQTVQQQLIMKVSDGIEQITIEDIAIGEVWIAGGQSNMEYQMYFDAEKEEELKLPGMGQFRFFECPKISFEDEETMYDFSDFGYWRSGSKEDMVWCSAVAYYFAKELIDLYAVPVGIVGCNFGGSPACAWMSEEALRNSPSQIWLDEYEQGVSEIDLKAYHDGFVNDPWSISNKPFPGEPEGLMYPGFSREKQAEFVAWMENANSDPEMAKLANTIGPEHPWRPCGLYHMMLSHIIPYTTRGVLWYQGESDDKHADIYDVVFTNLIKEWRTLWQEELPFLYVQIAPFGEWLGSTGEYYPILRCKQEEVSKKIPNVWMCSSSDCGMQWDIHPKHKRPIGHRLALLAREHIYGEEISSGAPCVDVVQVREDGLHFLFKNAKQLYLLDKQGNGKKEQGVVFGLFINGKEVKGTIDGAWLCVNIPPAEKYDIAYATTPYYEVNLYNEMDNPAMPFSCQVSTPASFDIPGV